MTIHDVDNSLRRKLQFNGSSGSSDGVGMRTMLSADDACFTRRVPSSSINWTVPGIRVSMVPDLS